MKKFLRFPVEILEELSINEMVVLTGGTSDTTITSPNNASGVCSGTNNQDGLCGGTNNHTGRCSGVNNHMGTCGD